MNETVNQALFQGHAKCILAGEHAVLRNHPALVLPLKEFHVNISYQPLDESLNADYVGSYGESILLMFWGTLKKAFELIEHDITQVKGKVIVENHIPMCAGLGFSAALCIAIGRWFIEMGWMQEDQLFDFARRLEDKFHQESSGVDIAGSISQHAVLYHKGQQPEKLDIQWQPKLYLSYSDHLSVTAEAVKKVKKLFIDDNEHARHVDMRMEESVNFARQALQQDETTGFHQLVDAINIAHNCFQSWGLVSHKLQKHIDKLAKLGAKAIKPTGAGEGGYVLSLWDEVPRGVPFELHPVF